MEVRTMKQFETWVKTNRGDFLRLVETDSQFGFYLCDDDQAWDGGFGIAESWEVVPIQAVPREELENIYCDEDVQLIIG